MTLSIRRRSLAIGAVSLALPGLARAQAAQQMSIATGTRISTWASPPAASVIECGLANTRGWG